jgi:hypothetical protein
MNAIAGAGVPRIPRTGPLLPSHPPPLGRIIVNADAPTVLCWLAIESISVGGWGGGGQQLASKCRRRANGFRGRKQRRDSRRRVGMGNGG